MTGCAVAGPCRSRQSVPAGLAGLGASRIRRGGEGAGSAHIACGIPAQHGRGGPECTEFAIYIRCARAGPAARKEVELTRSAHDAGAPWRTPSSGDARAVESVPRKRRAEGPLTAQGLYTPVAEGRRLAGDTWGVVYPSVAPVTEAIREIRGLHWSHCIRGTGLHFPSSSAERVRRAVLAERLLRPYRGVPVTSIAEAVLKGSGHTERR